MLLFSLNLLYNIYFTISINHLFITLFLKPMENFMKKQLRFGLYMYILSTCIFLHYFQSHSINSWQTNHNYSDHQRDENSQPNPRWIWLRRLGGLGLKGLEILAMGGGLRWEIGGFGTFLRTLLFLSLINVFYNGEFRVSEIAGVYLNFHISSN